MTKRSGLNFSSWREGLWFPRWFLLSWDELWKPWQGQGRGGWQLPNFVSAQIPAPCSSGFNSKAWSGPVFLGIHPFPLLTRALIPCKITTSEAAQKIRLLFPCPLCQRGWSWDEVPGYFPELRNSSAGSGWWGDLVRSQQDGKSPLSGFFIPTGFPFPSVLTDLGGEMCLVSLWVLSNHSCVSP